MEFLQGRIFHDPAIPGLTPSEKRACWFEAIGTLAKLHKVDFKSPKIGLEKFGRHSGFYERQLKTFTTISEAQAKAVDVETGEVVGPIPHFYEMVDTLRRHLPVDRSTIVHGDYKVNRLK